MRILCTDWVKSEQVGGSRSERVVEHADTDTKRERGRKRGPQLPGFDKTGKEVFI